jgi:hypothetical protein
VGIAVGVLALSPWVALNVGRFDRTTTLSSNLGLTLASANCDSTWYGSRIGYWSFWCAQAAGTDASLAHRDPSVVDAAARRQALDYIGDHRGRLPAVAAARVGRVLGIWRPVQGIGLDQAEGRPRPVAAMGLGAWWLAAGLSVVGVAALRRAGIPSFPAVAPIVVMLVGVLTAFASTRYRASAEPAVVVLAAAGAVHLSGLLARHRRPAVPPPQPA